MKKTLLSALTLFYNAVAFCQEKITIGTEDGKLTVTKTNVWYQSPWVWVVGAAVFILLLVALTRGGGRKD